MEEQSSLAPEALLRLMLWICSRQFLRPMKQRVTPHAGLRGVHCAATPAHRLLQSADELRFCRCDSRSTKVERAARVQYLGVGEWGSSPRRTPRRKQVHPEDSVNGDSNNN